MTLPRKYRFPLDKGKIFGKTYHEAFFNLVVKKDDNNKKRFAFVVGTKIAKKAVVRNKIRRRLQEGVMSLLPKIKPGGYIFYVKRTILDKNFREIKDELGKIFNTYNN